MGTGFERALYRIFSLAANFLPDPSGNSIAITGGFGSFSIFGITFLDPVVALETLLRAPGAWASLLAGSALTMLIAALMGRVFCGWICPVNTILEGFDALRKRALPRLGLRPPDIAAPRWLKWALLPAGLAAAVLADLALWAHFLPHVQIGRDVFSLMFFGGATIGAFILVAIILAELFFSRRVWCRSLCPTGALLGLLGSFALVRVRKGETPCLAECSACTRVCPMALNPAGAFSQAECVNCAVCVSACPADLLQLLPARPRRAGFPEVSPVLKRTAIYILILAGTLLPAAPAGAHHMRGLPHYGYAENYPQRPTKETRAVIMGYNVTVISYFFEGLRRERSVTPDDVQFYISLTDSKTHQSYTGPLSIAILHKSRQIAAFEHARPLEEAVYRVREAIPGPGRYELRLTVGKTHGNVFIDVEGHEVSKTPYIIAGLAVLLAALFLLNRRRFRFGRRRKIRVAPGA
jgi:ferredoxin-type protein NapH